MPRGGCAPRRLRCPGSGQTRRRQRPQPGKRAGAAGPELSPPRPGTLARGPSEGSGAPRGDPLEGESGEGSGYIEPPCRERAGSGICTEQRTEEGVYGKVPAGGERCSSANRAGGDGAWCEGWLGVPGQGLCREQGLQPSRRLRAFCPPPPSHPTAGLIVQRDCSICTWVGGEQSARSAAGRGECVGGRGGLMQGICTRWV